MRTQAVDALEIVRAQRKELKNIRTQAQQGRDFDAALERLERWKDRAVRLIADRVSGAEAEKLRQRNSMPVAFLGSADDGREVNMLADEYDTFLSGLEDEIASYPEHVLA